MFRLLSRGDFSYYEVDSFRDSGIVNHLFTTKTGGVSKGVYESMNLRFNCDDLHDNVVKNFEIAMTCLGTTVDHLVLTNQVHEDKIIDVTEADCGNGILFENKFPSADGLITATPGVVLSTFYADCVPIILLDKRKRVICSIHSGWRGTVSRIVSKGVYKMISDYNCTAEDIIAAIGPSIGVCHYEVSDDVADIFRHEFSDKVIEHCSNRYHVNMQLANKIQLMECGVPEANITVSGICTYCNADKLFSHRYTNGRRGNMAGFIVLK